MLVDVILPTAQAKLVTIEQNAPLVDGAKLLAHKEANLLVVCDPNGKLAGVVSKTDIVRQIGTCEGSSCTTPVSSVMSRRVLTCRRDEPLKAVWSEMKEHGFKHLPIVDQNSKPIGLAIARDVLVALMESVEYEEQLLRDYVMCIGYH